MKIKFVELSTVLSQQLNKILGFIRSLKFPSIYLVFPGRGSSQPKSSKNKLPAAVKRPPALILDTSAIIDGRIADIAQSGFLQGTLIMTSGVLTELQTIADSKNPLKRNRGRRGLEILQDLKKSRELLLLHLDYSPNDLNKLDESLIKLAKKLKGRIITVDYNLNQVGRLQGVKILNVNELANLIKTVVLPGEELKIKVIQEGKEKNQGVGYLPDGTLVVVENGRELIGKEIETVVERLLQTEAGRMIFVKVLADS